MTDLHPLQRNRAADGDGARAEQAARDRPALARRGVVEGFYGAPWTHEERLAFLAFAEQVGFNEYLYAPKDDPYHRDRWRDPYPEADLRRLADVVDAAARHGVRFVYALSPALTMRFADPAEHAALAAKAEQLWAIGVRSVVLLFDDVPATLGDPDDRARFGDGRAGTGRAHGDACRRFQEAFLLPHGAREPVTMCPTDYAGCAPSAYRDGLAETLPEDAVVLWTGADIVVGEVTRADVDAAAAAFGRRLLLWDNFPVNDFDRSRVFLGPLLGRTRDVEGSALVGVLANPMVEAAPSRFALASVADWARDPAAYDADASAAAALRLVAGPAADRLAPLVAACSSWPPDAPQSASLLRDTAAALLGDPSARAAVTAAGRALADAGTGPTSADDDAALLNALEPWLQAARAAGAALLAGCALLEAPDDDGRRAAARRALEASEDRYENVLRGVVPPFVRAVLGGSGDPVPAERPGPRVRVLTGPNPEPGDHGLVERLTAHGCRVVLGADGAEDAAADLVVVTPGADRAAAAAAGRTAVPVLAWGRLETLRLGTRSRVLMGQESVDLVDAAHPLAAGRTGRVVVHRGPGPLTALDPAPGGHVVARSVGGDAVLVHLPAGAALVDGSPAPADRVAFLLGTDGLAPWLVAPDGYALLEAAVDLLTAGSAEP